LSLVSTPQRIGWTILCPTGKQTVAWIQSFLELVRGKGGGEGPAQIVKSHPLATGLWAEKEPLCHEDLMLGRSGTSVPSVSIETGSQLIERFHVVQEAKEEFWDRWVQSS
jgi:hypothetical protein